MQALADLPFVAGHAGLDFVNTAEKRGHPLCEDVLRSPEDLRTWGVRYGLVSAAAATQDPDDELARAIGARELLYRLCFARVHGGTDDPGDLRRLAELTAAAHAAGSLERDDEGRLRWRWDPSDLAAVRHQAVVAAVDLLTADVAPRLKQCAGDHCGWFFLDRTKRGNRRWCAMSECGQAAKTARRRGRASPGASAGRSGQGPAGTA